MYQLHEISFKSTAEWDKAIARFDIKHLYHIGAWMDFIEETQPVTRKIYAIYDGDTVVGYFPGFILKRGPIRIFGSPLPGWCTDYLGPVLQQGVDMEALLRATASALRRDHIHYAELCHNALGWALTGNPEFHHMVRSTFIAPIAADPEEMLSGFSKSTRKAIKQSLRSELQIISSKDPSFIDVYYAQLREVFEKSGTEPTYQKERLRALWTHLMPTGRMLNTMVLKGDQCIASRIDLFGDDAMHSFGSASCREGLSFHPNEIARYHAMCEASKRGLKSYDMSGDGAYKAKFNAERVEVPVLIKSSRPLMVARQVMKAWHRCRIRVGYLLSKC
jgi:hypothetical protein